MERPSETRGQRGAVAICLREEKMLVIRRARTVRAPLAYCFPGGAIEAGETEEEALVRELCEEVGVRINPLRRLWRCTTPWNVELAWWLAKLDGDAVPVANPAEVESIHWLTPHEMAVLPDVLESNREFLRLIAAGEIRLRA